MSNNPNQSSATDTDDAPISVPFPSSGDDVDVDIQIDEDGTNNAAGTDGDSGTTSEFQPRRKKHVFMNREEENAHKIREAFYILTQGVDIMQYRESSGKY